MALNSTRYVTPDYTSKKKKTTEEYYDPRLNGAKPIKSTQKVTDNQVTVGEPVLPDPVKPVTETQGRNNTPYPTYYSPTANARYSYGQAQPTWAWNEAAPTWSYNEAAPTWTYDDSGRPGEFQWDDAGKPAEFSYKDAPTYNNRYQDQINQMVDAILNRQAFNYDYNQDPLYQQYAEAYTRNGNQAMQDTLAQVSARTGGLASSYANTASQQTYNGYMQALNDKIPELYQLAYSMYQDEGNNMRNNLNMVQGLENTDYGRYMDALGQYNVDRNLAYDQWANQLNQYNADRNFAYGQYQDLWDRYYNDRNFSYGQYQDALNQYNNDRNFSYGQYQDALSQYNNDRNFSYGQYQDQLDRWYQDRDFDYDLWSDNLSRQEAAAKANYNAQVAAWNAQNKSGGPANTGDNGGSPNGTNSENTGSNNSNGATPQNYKSIQPVQNSGSGQIVSINGKSFNLKNTNGGQGSLQDLIGWLNTPIFTDYERSTAFNTLKNRYGINVSLN